ncbi:MULTISPECIES: MarC family protein [unclassified Lebetimonas]|uniref:MarC family protein n=1 Tax=unclassified Lebetimonas TaxID=2648158 RepID=UPI000462FE1A|nr:MULTISPECIES: MarC family protein [unclassified Lebetimonas]
MLKAILFDTISLITILNPIAAAAIMISLVKYSDIAYVSKKASITVFIASVITMIAGGWVLKIFGINLPSIKAIGGVVLLIIALNMIQGKEISPTNTTKDEHEAAQEKDNIAIIPLAIPVLFGPGVITTIIVLSEKSKKLIDKGVLFTAIVLSALIVYITLKNASFISKFLGVNGIKIVTRLMGLIIGAISFLFLIGGVKALWLIS